MYFGELFFKISRISVYPVVLREQPLRIMDTNNDEYKSTHYLDKCSKAFSGTMNGSITQLKIGFARLKNDLCDHALNEKRITTLYSYILTFLLTLERLMQHVTQALNPIFNLLEAGV